MKTKCSKLLKIQTKKFQQAINYYSLDILCLLLTLCTVPVMKSIDFHGNNFVGI